MMQEVSNKHPAAMEVVIQSDKGTFFASQDQIPFLHYMNAESRLNGKPIVTNWIFKEAQTVRVRLDTHFSYFNFTLK